MRLALSLILLAVLSGAARAGNEVGVVVTGDGSIQPQLTAQINDWLAQHKHALVPAPLPPDAVTALHDCFVLDDHACARDVIDKRARAHSVIFAVVDVAKAANGMRDITLTVYWFEKGREALVERRSCERCTDQTLRASADDLMEHLSGTAAKAHGHLHVISKPVGARVTVDGEDVGVAPLDYDVSPGEHTVGCASPHHGDGKRTVTLKAGETAVIDLTLASQEPGGGGDGDDRSAAARYAPYALVGVGGALAITGVVMIAIDENPSPTGSYYIRNTGPTGIGLAIGGVVVGGVGGYLWWRGAHAHHSAPVAAVSRDGAYVGWLGRF